MNTLAKMGPSPAAVDQESFSGASVAKSVGSSKQSRQYSSPSGVKRRRGFGPLSVTAPMVGHRLLTPIVAAFCRDHPRVSLHLSYNDALRVGPSKDSSLRMRKLFTVRYGVCACPRTSKNTDGQRAPKISSRIGGSRSRH